MLTLKTKLNLSLIALIVTLGAVFLFNYYTLKIIEEDKKHTAKVRKLRESCFQLMLLTNENEIRGDTSSREQRDKIIGFQRRAISELSGRSEEDRTILAGVKQVFVELDSLQRKRSNIEVQLEKDSVIDVRLDEINLQILSSLQEFHSALGGYYTIQGLRLQKDEKNQRVCVQAASVGVTTAIVITLIILLRSNLIRINMLRKAFREISSENLDVRLPVENKDEFGELVIEFNSMAKLLKDTVVSRKELELQEHLFREIFELGSVGMALTSPEKGWIKVNKELCSFFGFEEWELTKLTWAELTYPDDLEEDVGYFNEVMEGKREGYSMDKRFVHRTGKILYAHISTVCIRNAQGKVEYFIAHVVDTSEREKMVARLEKSNDDLERFAYLTSHDLQEPLRIIMSYAELLQVKLGKKLNQDVETCLEFLIKSAEKMNDMIQALLQLSRIGRTAPTFASISISSIIKELKEDVFYDSIKHKNAVIEVGELPILRGDRRLLTQLFQNLISNSLKFTQKTPLIKITAEFKDHMHIISVTDNGIGIDPKYHQEVFQVFRRLHTQEEYKGTGIGLSICSRIVEHHGGRLELKSAKNGGSEFQIIIPELQADIDGFGGSNE